jgi:hypothetical protein
MIDHTKDASGKDNWVETVAAFASSFGGLLFFGEWRGRTINLVA